MTQLDTSLPAVLRRRAKTLEEHYPVSFILPLLRAADELKVRQKFALEDGHDGREQLVVDCVATNRRLRVALNEVGLIVHGSSMAAKLRLRCEKIIGDAFNLTADYAKGRKILTLEVVHGQSRAVIEAHIRQVLDAYYLHGLTGVRSSDEPKTGDDDGVRAAPHAEGVDAVEPPADQA